MEYSSDDLDSANSAFPNGIPVPPVFTPECPLPGTALTCLNGLKHGGTARLLFIPGEQPQDFYNLLAESFETHQPSTIEHSALVTDSVLARWFLWRRQRAYSKREFEIFLELAQDDSPTPSGVKELELYDRYCTAAERKLSRALANLERVKKSALNEQKWRAQHESQKAKFDLDRQRFELRKEQDARVAPKIKAESERATLHANEIIAIYKQEQRAAWRKQGPMMEENGERVIIQHCIPFESDGVMKPGIFPSNQDVEKMIADRDYYLLPPRKVIRHFHFGNGVIPPPYRAIIGQLDRTGTSIDTDSPPNQGIRCPMTFDQWRHLASEERQHFKNAA
jgi:hypothetical protein